VPINTSAQSCIAGYAGEHCETGGTISVFGKILVGSLVTVAALATVLVARHCVAKYKRESSWANDACAQFGVDGSGIVDGLGAGLVMPAPGPPAELEFDKLELATDYHRSHTWHNAHGAGLPESGLAAAGSTKQLNPMGGGTD
jgi:hypothetical protein